jgi:hypothetical protein
MRTSRDGGDERSGVAELDNVVVVRFGDSSKAFEALSVLRDCDAQGRIGLGAAEVAERSNDGVLTQREGPARTRSPQPRAAASSAC